jgi:hypothetical protein
MAQRALKAAHRRRVAHQAALAAVLEDESPETVAAAVRAIDDCAAHRDEDTATGRVYGLPPLNYARDRLLRAALVGEG